MRVPLLLDPTDDNTTIGFAGYLGAIFVMWLQSL